MVNMKIISCKFLRVGLLITLMGLTFSKPILAHIHGVSRAWTTYLGELKKSYTRYCAGRANEQDMRRIKRVERGATVCALIAAFTIIYSVRRRFKIVLLPTPANDETKQTSLGTEQKLLCYAPLQGEHEERREERTVDSAANTNQDERQVRSVPATMTQATQTDAVPAVSSSASLLRPQTHKKPIAREQKPKKSVPMKECTICCEERQVVPFPCKNDKDEVRHTEYLVCSDCIDNVKGCPLCRAAVSEAARVASNTQMFSGLRKGFLL